ncbi:glutaredoxin 3 [Stenotrophomonas maltophilia]|nr:glutaredoxin 3 [Stenotrophomonas maltophilia]MDG9769688.1 glutaredoxin 3 [Stenotrophomonas maltophilia]MDH0541570.1 glutaredoxin 3 [Stenotrophomonas maltophilia]MDH0794277.1 glutaredoxin 3 [Stenotrophomonas maltophilia]MDH2034811.1 glutaredoxin 3 [Stenotrophomonas maltophilia]HDS1605746.1 glutaredoxin 3 [Stenotrophomonas maltophilia]
MKPDVLVYTKSWCPYCRRAMELLKEKGVQWKSIDIGSDPARRQAMVEASGRGTVPQIFINGTHVGGCDDLFDLDAAGGLDELLARPPPQD